MLIIKSKKLTLTRGLHILGHVIKVFLNFAAQFEMWRIGITYQVDMRADNGQSKRYENCGNQKFIQMP